MKHPREQKLAPPVNSGVCAQVTAAVLLHRRIAAHAYMDPQWNN